MEINNGHVNALFARAACYNRLGYFQKAIEDYSLALDKDSKKVYKKENIKNISKILDLNNATIGESFLENMRSFSGATSGMEEERLISSKVMKDYRPNQSGTGTIGGTNMNPVISKSYYQQLLETINIDSKANKKPISSNNQFNTSANAKFDIDIGKNVLLSPESIKFQKDELSYLDGDKEFLYN